MSDNITFLGIVALTLWKYSLLFSCLTVFDLVLILLCIGVSLQGVDSFKQAGQSFELHGLEKDMSEVSLMFHVFLSVTLLSFWVLNLNKFWMISFLEIISFFRNSIFLFLGYVWSFYLLGFLTDFHVVNSVFHWFCFLQSFLFWFSCPAAESFDFLKFGMTVYCVDQVKSIWESLRFCLAWDRLIRE